MNKDRSKQPSKRTAAGALITDEQGRVLLVNPTYKPAWEIPGGIVEENEAPRAAARREVREEIGLDMEPGRLLSLDYRHASSRRHIDILRFIFQGGALSPEEAANIRVQAEELSEWGFFTLAEAQARLTPDLGRVVAGCLDILDGIETQYIEHAEFDGVMGV